VKITISVTVAHTQSAIQAEAQAINLAEVRINRLNIQQAAILTDNLTLAKAAEARSPNSRKQQRQDLLIALHQERFRCFIFLELIIVRLMKQPSYQGLRIYFLDRFLRLAVVMFSIKNGIVP
jgi:hypothetical protein